MCRLVGNNMQKDVFEQILWLKMNIKRKWKCSRRNNLTKLRPPHCWQQHDEMHEEYEDELLTFCIQQKTSFHMCSAVTVSSLVLFNPDLLSSLFLRMMSHKVAAGKKTNQLNSFSHFEDIQIFLFSPATVLWRRFFVFLAGNTNGAHQDFVKKLKGYGQTEVNSPHDADYVLLFCPVASGAGPDLSAALSRAPGKTGSWAEAQLVSPEWCRETLTVT